MSTGKTALSKPWKQHRAEFKANVTLTILKELKTFYNWPGTCSTVYVG